MLRSPIQIDTVIHGLAKRSLPYITGVDSIRSLFEMSVLIFLTDHMNHLVDDDDKDVINRELKSRLDERLAEFDRIPRVNKKMKG